jgi:hypothetical protein
MYYRLIPDKFEPIYLEKQKDDQTLFESVDIESKKLNKEPWSFSKPLVKSLLEKIDSIGTMIGEILFIGEGMGSGRNKIFCGFSNEEIKEFGLESDSFFIRARNSDIQRYYFCKSQNYIIYLEDFGRFEDLPVSLQKYLKENEKELKTRAAYRRGDCVWWKYAWPLHKEYYNRIRILCPYLAKDNRFALDINKEFLGLTDTTVLFENGQEENIKYILGLLNSQLLNYRFKFIGKLKSGNTREYFWNSISKLSIRKIDFNNQDDVNIHNQIVEYVDRILSLYGKLYSLPNGHRDKSQILLELKVLDKEIDNLVYRLYKLTDEEIGIVKEN